MIEMELAKMLFALCFAGGVVVSMLMTVLVIGVFFAARLWTLRDDLEEMGETLRDVLMTLKEEP